MIEYIQGVVIRSMQFYKKCIDIFKKNILKGILNHEKDTK